MNNHALNLLTTTTVESNSSNSGSSLSCQSQSSGNERQMALASLFNSLTSLANNCQQQQQQQSTTVASFNPQQQQNTQPPTTSIALTNSFQSVMAAAMIQQQLASSASITNQHSQYQNQQATVSLGDQNKMFSSTGNHHQGVVTNSTNQQQQQRINYCTICNKELCNKYFMKTHMLKMHGINLEMEQTCEGQDEGIEESEDDEREEIDKEQPTSECSSEALSFSGSKNLGLKRSSSSGSAQNLAKSGKKQSSSAKATSVLNGFAGNSMGGVVCNICNKELCSKYFLKVHKQNTHGIVTDYQDSNQFMYPFVPQIAAPNPFTNLSPLGPSMVPSAPFAPNPINIFANKQQQQPEDYTSANKKSTSSAKRARLNQQPKQQLAAMQQQGYIEQADGNQINSKQCDPVYRLMLAQHQHQLQQPLPSASGPPLMSLDPMIVNSPLNALLCFGAVGGSGPFGSPAVMSPAMIVDNILRNQHLFNRNTTTNSAVTNQTAPKSNTDKNNNSNNSSNNNDSKPSQFGNKVSKDPASNSRYFSHYTEACPMCDRRFKSIKWLKTHMMNDHKQEIGAYMQMMMQYLYTSKSQQMAAAAAIASMEQQKHQQNLVQHLTNQQLPLDQRQQQASFIDRFCNQNNLSHFNQSPVNNIRPTGLGSPFRQSSPSAIPHDLTGRSCERVSGDYMSTEYNQCRQESLSPNESPKNEHLPPSSSRSQPLNFASSNNQFVCNLNLELAHSKDYRSESLLYPQSLNDDIEEHNDKDNLSNESGRNSSNEDEVAIDVAESNNLSLESS